MADATEIVVGSLITIACSSGAASLLLKRKRKHRVGEKVHPRKSTVRRMQHSTAGACCYVSGEMRSVYANGHRGIWGIAVHGRERHRWSGCAVSFPNSTTRTHRLCLQPDQTHGQNPYMSRLNRHVYDQTKSADLSETRADLSGLCRRQGRRPGSPTKSGRSRLVEFGHKPAAQKLE